MKKLLAIAVILLSGSVLATPALKKLNFAPVYWNSSNPSDIITIQNTTSAPYPVFIAVNGSGSYINGINIKNCGSVTHINYRSSAICTVTQDNPISFSSDGNTGAAGNYQVGN